MTKARDLADGTFNDEVTVQGAFTSQGIDDNADATAITIDSSENVLVGKTSSSSTVQGISLKPNGQGVFTSDGGSGALFNRLTSDGNILEFRKDGSTVGSIGTDSGNFNVDGGANKAGVQFTGSSILPRDNSANADAAITLGGSSSRFSNLYLSGGVYLGGVVGDNLLSDYEVGFFEPSLLGSVSDPTVTWDNVVGQEGWYVKVGRMVHIQINFRTDSVSGGSGNLYVGNLPFASPGLAGQGGMASFAIARAKDWPSNTPCAAYVNEGTDFIILEYRTSANGDNATSQVSDLGTGLNDNLLCISGTYYVS